MGRGWCDLVGRSRIVNADRMRALIPGLLLAAACGTSPAVSDTTRLEPPDVAPDPELAASTSDLLMTMGVEPLPELVACVASTDGVTVEGTEVVYSDSGRRWLLGLIECDADALAAAIAGGRGIAGASPEETRCVVLGRLSAFIELPTEAALDAIEAGGVLNPEMSPELAEQIGADCGVDGADIPFIIFESGN